MKLRLLSVISIFSGFSIVLAADGPRADYELKRIQLPGANGPVGLDYFAHDPATAKTWVPASNTGNVDVIDEKTDAVSPIPGFKTAEIEGRSGKRIVGPTSATIDDGVVYVGNRGDASICVVDAKSLELGECVPFSTDHSIMPDGIAYVAATKEIWATVRPIGASNIPRAKSLQIFDAADPRHLKWKSEIPLDNLGEGYAVDNGRGLFYTNVEESGATLAIDVRTKKIVSTWNAGCPQVGGVVEDSARGFLFIACGNRVVNIDVAHDGKFLDSITTGAGLDNIDYSSAKKLLYAAAGQAAMLTIAEVGDDGKFHLRASVPTVPGARNVVAAGEDTAYLIDPAGGTIIKATPKVAH